jgi:Putative DNA-binding domain
MKSPKELEIKPPKRLQYLQEHFSEAIRTPFSFATGKFACQTELYALEAVSSIRPRIGEAPQHRLALYNEQYWYRLLTLLQKDYSLLAHIMGYWHFNQLATAYLTHYPSQSPYLDHLPLRLPDFMRSQEQWGQVQLVQAADLDLAYLNAFHASDKPSLHESLLHADKAHALAESSFEFQPWFSLLEEDWNLMECRKSLTRNELPIEKTKLERVEKKGYWAMYRNDHQVHWLSLEYEAFRLFREIQSGLTLAEACERIAGSLDEVGLQRLGSGIQGWFAQAMRLRWFCTGLKKWRVKSLGKPNR